MPEKHVRIIKAPLTIWQPGPFRLRPKTLIAFSLLLCRRTGTAAGVGSAGVAVSPSFASQGPLVNILSRLIGMVPYGISWARLTIKSRLTARAHLTSGVPLTARVPLTTKPLSRFLWLSWLNLTIRGPPGCKGALWLSGPNYLWKGSIIPKALVACNRPFRGPPKVRHFFIFLCFYLWTSPRSQKWWV